MRRRPSSARRRAWLTPAAALAVGLAVLAATTAALADATTIPAKAATAPSDAATAPADAATAPAVVETVMKVSPPVLVARPTAEAIKIDGDLSEPAWQAATAASDFTLVLDTSMKAQFQTAVSALYDKDNLYIAMVCQEPNVDRLVKLGEKRDETAYSDDRVEVLLDPSGEGKDVYDFSLTAGNVQYDAKCLTYTKPFLVYLTTSMVTVPRAYHEVDAAWNAEWPSAVATGEGKWTAEMALPLAAIGLDPARNRLPRANFSRVRVTYNPSRRGGQSLNVKPEESVWSPPKGDLQTPALFGFVALADADGKTLPVPATMEVAVPGLPGMPGVPSDQTVPDRLKLTVRADKPGRPLKRFWDSLNSFPAPSEFFDRTYAKGYVTQIRCGGGWPRGAGLIDGTLEGDFSSVDSQFDMLKKYNIRAVVTLNNRPGGIEYKTITDPRWGRVSGPPKDERDYSLIYAAYRSYFQYVHDRYGREFFDSLRFEFWNEPDGADRFFSGTVEDYCKWYDWVATALKDVSPTGKIGGPAVTGGGFDFTKAFLEHCHDGVNAATGKKGAPVDFLSFHTYGWRAQLTPGAFTDTILTMARFWRILADTGFAGMEVQVTEWGIEPTGNASGPYYWFRKTHYAPVWMAKLVKEADDATQTYADMKARIDGLSLCISGTTERPPFAGTRSLFIDKYVPKPYFNGYVLLNELGDERIPVDGPASPRIGCMATKRQDGSLAVLVFHFKEYARTSPPQEDITVELAGLAKEGKTISQMRVDEKTSNSYTAWVEMGSPTEITDETAQKLTEAATVRKTPLQADKDGLVQLNMPVNSVAVVLVE